MKNTSWRTLKTERFGRYKNRPNDNKKHTAWIGSGQFGTFGPAGDAISLITGEVLKRSPKADEQLEKAKRLERQKFKDSKNL